MFEKLLLAIREVRKESKESWQKFQEELAKIESANLENCQGLDNKSLPLFVASETENPDVVLALITKCPNITHVLNDRGQPALFWANDYGNIGNILLSRMSTSLITCNDNEGNNILHIQAGNIGNLELFKKLCEIFPQLRDQLNKNNETPLHRTYDAEKVKVLIENMSEQAICQKSTSEDSQYNGSTALHNAVLAHNIEVIKLLIEKCPELAWIKNQQGKNAFNLTNDPIITDIILSAVKEKMESITSEKQKLTEEIEHLKNDNKTSELRKLTSQGADNPEYNSVKYSGQLIENECKDDYSDF